MKLNAPLVPDYDLQEERINYLSHGVGAALAFIAGILLIIKGAYLSTGTMARFVGLCNKHGTAFFCFNAVSHGNRSRPSLFL